MYILRLREFAREFVEKAEKFFFTWNFFLRDFRNNNVMGFFCKEFSSWGFLFLFSRDFPATKLPFAEFPLTFFPFSFCGGVCPSAAGFPILSFRGFPVFLYGIFPVLPLRFFPSSSPRGFSILPRGVFLFFPAEFPSDMRQRKLPELSGSFFLRRWRFHFLERVV